jgi:hypothetical protein
MKISLFLASLFFAACASPREKPVNDSVPAQAISTVTLKDSTDTVVPGKIAVTIPDSPKVQNKQGIFPLMTGVVYYNLRYCGGARPTEENLKALAEYTRLDSSTLLLKNKSGIYELHTDTNGAFRQAIPSGDYEVYLTKGVNPKIYNVAPESCDECLTKAITTVSLQPSTETEIRFTFRCPPMDHLRQ